jgi:hypothetical protein
MASQRSPALRLLAIPSLALAAGMACGGPATAGPPFVTDDPEPVDFRHFEINSAAQGTLTHGARSGEAPSLDINYGLLPETQFHIGLFGPWQTQDGKASQFGYGDTEFGLKYRFVAEDEAGWRPQVALYPNIDLPTGDEARGLGAGHTRIFLPLWAQKTIGDWQTYGGGGYWINRYGDNRNYWFMGWTLLRKITDRLTLGGEIFHQTADLNSEPAPTGNGVSSRPSTGFNLGGYYILDENHSILFSAGRGLQNVPATNQFSYYIGLQLSF